MDVLDAPERVTCERLVLTRLVADDARALYPVMSDPDAETLREWMEWDAVSPLAVAEYATEYEHRWEAGECAAYLVRRRGEETPAGAGFVYLEHRERIGPGRAEIGLWLHPAHWDEGLGAELADALTWVAVDHLGCSDVDAATDPDNERAARMLRVWAERHEGEEVGVVVGESGDPERRFTVSAESVESVGSTESAEEAT